VTTLDVVRASRFLGEIKNADPKDVKVTVVGGHSGVTIVPLLSQTPQGKDVKGEEYKALVKRIQFGGDGASSSSLVLELKKGRGRPGQGWYWLRHPFHGLR
jgi:malate/lactate dehydrogenase